MGLRIQRIVAQETREIGEHLLPAAAALRLTGERQEELACPGGVHPPAAALAPLPGLVHEPEIRPEQRKGIRDIPDPFRDPAVQFRQDLPPEDGVYGNIRHIRSPPCFRGHSPIFGSVYHYLQAATRQTARLLF